MKIICCEYFTLKYLLLFEICARELYKKFDDKHSEKILAYFLRNLQTLWAHNSRIHRIKNAKFSGYCFDMNINILEDFQICISIPLMKVTMICRGATCFTDSEMMEYYQKTCGWKNMPIKTKNYVTYYIRYTTLKKHF